MSGLAKLRWQCRRGTLELDILLARYLDNRYPHVPQAEQALFSELLALEDDVLITLLLGDTQPSADHPFQSLIQTIRNP